MTIKVEIMAAADSHSIGAVAGSSHLIQSLRQRENKTGPGMSFLNVKAQSMTHFLEQGHTHSNRAVPLHPF